MKEKILVSIVAESPGIVTECLEYFKNEKIKNIILYPRDEKIKWRIDLLKKVLKKRYKEVESKFFKLPLNDIESDKDIKKFENFLKKLKKELRKREVIFNISGGRKIMILALYRFLIKNKIKKVKLVNVVSYLSREELGTLEDVIREKYESGIELTEDEINKYFYSNNKYKVFVINL